MNLNIRQFIYIITHEHDWPITVFILTDEINDHVSKSNELIRIQLF